MNWRIIVGGLLIFGAVSEMVSIWKDYSSGKLAFCHLEQKLPLL